MRHMIAENLILDAAQCRTNRHDQRYDVDAVAVFLNHPCDTAHLTLDPTKTLRAGGLAVSLHDCYIPPMGITCKPREGQSQWLRNILQLLKKIRAVARISLDRTKRCMIRFAG